MFGPELARAVDAELRQRFAATPHDDVYRSEEVNAAGWALLQQLATSMLGRDAVPQLATIEAYQAVYIPRDAGVEHVAIANAADPLQIGSLPRLLDELQRFAASASLPTDTLELMQLAAHYLEDDAAFERELDVQTYVQLMLSAKEASARGQALWVVV